ncbi:MAG: 4Fe-4S binding protein [Vampirovibrionales bacterium]|nr:4Fe-4S binding protein [Vampirovibrionales bacterium]
MSWFKMTAKQDALKQVADALSNHTYFKLICGASFHDVDKINALVQIYAQAGIDCVDVACEPHVLKAVEDAYQLLPIDTPKPLVMVSLDVDGDPHFRKIHVTRSACVDCEACLPACPVDALFMDADHQFQINSDRCYGCSRCLPTCPSDALYFQPTHALPEALLEVLKHPLVGAVELHANHLEITSLQRLFDALGTSLSQKWISLCFRPAEHTADKVNTYLDRFNALCESVQPYGVMLQIDGNAMQADELYQSSLPALAGATALAERWKTRFPVTLSGGINAETARLLEEEAHQWIAGVGMGTLARKRVWHYLDDEATFPQAHAVASYLVGAFKK